MTERRCSCVLGNAARHPLSDAAQFRLRTVEGRARCEPAENIHARPGARLENRRIEPQRYPVAVIDREAESRWHDPDDRIQPVAELDLAIEDGWISAKLPAPHLMADHNDVRCAGALVFRPQASACRRRYPCDVETRRGHFGDRHGLRLVPLQNKVASDRPKGADLLDRSQLLAPCSELMDRPLLPVVRGDIPVDDGYDAIALFERERRIEHIVRDREGGRCDGDTEGHTDHTDERQPRVADEHARQAQIHPGEPRCRRGMSPAFAQSFHRDGKAKEDRLPQYHAARRAITVHPPVKHFFEVAGRVLTDVGWKRGPKQPLAETGRTQRREPAARLLRPPPRIDALPHAVEHLTRYAVRPPSAQAAPGPASLGRGRSLIVDESIPFCSSLRRVT